MDKLKKLITESLSKYQILDSCKSCNNSPILVESKQYDMPISEAMRYHIDSKLQLTENIYRPGSISHQKLLTEARILWTKGIIELKGTDKKIFETTDIGRWAKYEGQFVPLDLPLMEIITEGQDAVCATCGEHGYDEDLDRPCTNCGDNNWSTDYEGLGDEFDEIYETKSEFPDIYKGNNDIIFTKTKTNIRTDGTPLTNYKLTWKGHDIDPGGHNFSSFKELQDFASDYILSNQIYNKLRYEDPITEAEYHGKEVSLGKPKRGGSKKFYVYVKDGSKVKKVSFGMAGGGLRAKLNNPKARKAFSDRHNCPQKKDKTKASYWSCRLPRYAKLLGFKTTFTGYW